MVCRSPASYVFSFISRRFSRSAIYASRRPISRSVSLTNLLCALRASLRSRSAYPSDRLVASSRSRTCSRAKHQRRPISCVELSLSSLGTSRAARFAALFVRACHFSRSGEIVRFDPVPSSLRTASIVGFLPPKSRFSAAAATENSFTKVGGRRASASPLPSRNVLRCFAMVFSEPPPSTSLISFRVGSLSCESRVVAALATASYVAYTITHHSPCQTI